MLKSTIKTFIVTAFVLLTTNEVSAQQRPLTNSRTSSFYTYLYALTPDDVLAFYKASPKSLKDKTMHTLVDSFRTDEQWQNKLPAGNYLKVYAAENQLKYELIENRSVFIQLFETSLEHRLALTDRSGNFVTKAQVSFDGKIADFDPATGTWYFKNTKDTALLKVVYAGVTNFFKVGKGYNYYRQRKQGWLKDICRALFPKKNRYGQALTYNAFMAFNKPIYKPGDTVKLKALVFNTKGGKPITDKRARVIVSESNSKESKLIGTANSYRPGAFTYHFVLNDSLNLSLDERYSVELIKDDGRPIVVELDDEERRYRETVKRTLATGYFDFEEYELKSINFKVRLDKADHRAGEQNALFIKATNENELPVPDGRVELTVTTASINNYIEKKDFIKDTLWVHKQKLDGLGETKIILPDSIFPKADLQYVVNARFLNSDNEVRNDIAYGSLKADPLYLKSEVLKNQLSLDLRNATETLKREATVSALTRGGDTLSKLKLNLPAQMALNPNAALYDVTTDSLNKEINIANISDDVSISGDRTADSAFVVIKNPRNLAIFYKLFDGTKQLANGQSSSDINYRQANKNDHLLTLGVDYLWAGQMRHQERSLVREKNRLQVAVKQPISVYPGQSVQTSIVVTDVNGTPVPGADVTAWSLTRKFEGYNIPSVPNFEKYGPPPKRITRYDLLADTEIAGKLKLNWLKQGKRLGLDSIEFFKFTYPTRTYAVAETGKDTITQIAPFVVKDGELLPIHIVYLDGEPVYFSKAQHLQPYSFKVRPGMHNIKLRTSNLELSADSILVPPGKKFVISFNADAFNVKSKSDTLDSDEARLLNSRMITIVNNFNNVKTLLKQTDRNFFLNPTGYAPSQVLVGPLAKDYSFFESGTVTYPPFNAEAGYKYRFEPGWVTQKSLPTSVAFGKTLSQSLVNSYKQYVLTNDDINSIWSDYIDDRISSQYIINNENVTGQTGKLVIERALNPYQNQNIKSVILFRNDDPQFIRIYPGNTTVFGNLNPGIYRAFYLFRNNDYEVKENVRVAPYGVNYYRQDISPKHCKDSVSQSIITIITKSIEQQTNRYVEATENTKDQLLEAFNSKFLDKKLLVNKVVGIVIDAADNSPLPGVNIKIKGTNIGTLTGVNGFFELPAPVKGKLQASFIGYYPQEVAITTGKLLKVELRGAANKLQEVAVVGYGGVRKKELSGAVTNVVFENMLAGKVSGISVLTDSIGTPGASTIVRLRGAAGFTGGARPLMVVDGVIVSDTKDMPASSIADVTVLKDAAAKALYGSMGANGVIVITTKQAAKQITAAEGQLHGEQTTLLRRNFNDYAYWQPRLTTDEQGKVSFVSTFPDDITNWRTFVVAATGNKQTGRAEGAIKSFKPLSANFISPQFAVAGDEMKLIAKVMNYAAAPAQVNRKFSYDGKLIKQDQFSVANAKIDTFSIVAADKDSLNFEYGINKESYFDGESRTVPVFKAGITESKGIFAALQADTSLTMTFDKNLGPVVLRAEGAVLPVLAQEAEHLRNYKYLCNEQLASKLKALLAEIRIAKAMNADFKYYNNVKDIIKKLSDNRETAGTWGWWKDSEEEMWISLHATEALLEAEYAGFKTPLNKQKLIDYLVYQLDEYNVADKLQCLQILAKLKANVDYPKLISAISIDMAKKKWTTDYDRLELLSIKQQQGIIINVDSLMAKAKHTMFGNIYWGESKSRLFDNSIQETVLAYKIIKKANQYQGVLQKIRGYLLEQRKAGQWRNTYESACILEALLPDVLDENRKAVESKLIIRGAIEKVINQFPFTDTIAGSSIALVKTGKLPVYVSGYQKFWNSKPGKVSKEFEVDTWFERNSSKITDLKAGETVYLQAKVQVRADADHLMVEIPIPAGCSYEEKEQQWANNEVHREHFKEKVSVFCGKLKPGSYIFKVKLMPRYNGSYTLNPAKAELMYFPVFYGREEIKKVAIN